MIGTVPLRSHSPSSLFLEYADVPRWRPSPSSSSRSAPAAVRNSQRSNASIPKLEPFSRSRIDRRIEEPSFLQKSENNLTDYCSTLEGDDSSSCWRAYFELKDLEKELPKEDVEKFIRQAGGLKSLIDCVHGITAMLRKNSQDLKKVAMSNAEKQSERPLPAPDGLPKTQEELEEEENARMPDSPFTRLLRNMGKLPAWYSQAPDHETD